MALSANNLLHQVKQFRNGLLCKPAEKTRDNRKFVRLKPKLYSHPLKRKFVKSLLF